MDYENGAIVRAFYASCSSNTAVSVIRPQFRLDGTNMCSNFKGILLCAVGFDSIGRSVPGASLG